MAFNLWTDGVRLLSRISRELNTHYIHNDPLSGIVDSSNVVFFSTYTPILSSGSTEVRDNTNAVVSSGSYSVDHEPGTFTFTFAPIYQPRATYTTARFPDRVLRSFLVAGFDEMESRWSRGYTLSDVVGVSIVNPITEDSAAAYVVNTSGSQPVLNASGPLGPIYVFDSRTQIGFFTKCVHYAYLLILLGEHAQSDFIWTEAQGLRVDKSAIPKNLELAKQNVLKALERAQEVAQVEQMGTALYGGAITSPLTREYIAHRFWEKRSKDEDWRSSTPWVGHVW